MAWTFRSPRAARAAYRQDEGCGEASGRRKLQALDGRQVMKAFVCTVLSKLGIASGTDFHALRSSQVTDLLLAADLLKYRKPKNANGSRARYFHAYLQRVCR